MSGLAASLLTYSLLYLLPKARSAWPLLETVSAEIDTPLEMAMASAIGLVALRLLGFLLRLANRKARAMGTWKCLKSRYRQRRKSRRVKPQREQRGWLQRIKAAMRAALGV